MMIYNVKTIENCWIPMPDGKKLAAIIWMPVNASDKPVPGILEISHTVKAILLRFVIQGFTPGLQSGDMPVSGLISGEVEIQMVF